MKDTNMGSANDSVIICEEQKPKTPRRNPVRQARVSGRNLSINLSDNATNLPSRIPLRTVYESSSRQNKKILGCYELSISNKHKRMRESEKISPRKRRKTIDLCETIILSDDESEDKKGNHRAQSTPSLSRTNGTSDVLLLNRSKKDATSTNKNKKILKKKRRKSGQMTQKPVRNGRDEDDVAVVWTSNNEAANNEAKPSLEKIKTNNKPLFFVDVVGDKSNFHRRSLNRTTKYTLPSQKDLGLPIFNDKTISMPSTSQVSTALNKMIFNQYCVLLGNPPNLVANNNEKKNELLLKPKREIIVDGLNVTHGYTRKKDVFSKTGLELVLNYFRGRGHDVKIFLPQHTRNREREFLENWYRKGYVIFTPSRKIGGKTISSYDDRFILDYATKCKGIVVSSDQYRDLWQEKPEWRETIESRLLIPTFVGDYVMFPDDPLGRSGPSLDEFLRH